MTLPAGHRLQWTRQYEFLAEMEARLRYVIPLTLALVFVLLYLSMQGWPQTLLVLCSRGDNRVRAAAAAWESGVGADVSARTAAPLVGGIWSCMVLTLLVLPAAYAMWPRRHVPEWVAALPADDPQAAVEAGPRTSGAPRSAE